MAEILTKEKAQELITSLPQEQIVTGQEELMEMSIGAGNCARIGAENCALNFA